ncbi:hypothetical protein [Mycobacterium sp. M26]|uniref:hypothetical protein n=1 Tax=Mycobacterium sp. M26 TaxID=1762962 RepID=UPI0012E38302|nr:hypothetical protein [Mycobacterium sp. M26]
MPIDDCVWIVSPDGLVARGIPVGNPIHPPTLPDDLFARTPNLESPRAFWNRKAVTYEEAQSAIAAFPLTLYRGRGDWMTYEELFASVSAEAAAISPEEAGWRNGEFDANDYIIEACQVGLYESVDVAPTIVTQYTDGMNRWTKDRLRQKVFPEFALADGGFDDWLSSALRAGELRTVDFLQYIAEGYEDGDPNGIVMECRIIDAN